MPKKYECEECGYKGHETPDALCPECGSKFYGFSKEELVEEILRLREIRSEAKRIDMLIGDKETEKIQGQIEFLETCDPPLEQRNGKTWTLLLMSSSYDLFNHVKNLLATRAKIIESLEIKSKETENLFEKGKDINGFPITTQRNEWLSGYLAGLNLAINKLHKPEEEDK